jgi:small-conductance mechanosensitive channel
LEDLQVSNLVDKAIEWFSDPVLGKLVAGLVAIILGIVAVRLVQRVTTRYIDDKNARYRARKAIGFIGYLSAILILATVFSDRLGRLTVVFGVAGAGIAFALQEVIASIAGWAAVSFGGYYKIGDRVQLGGIVGDVIDIGLLRTTLMEVGAWVNGDLYNGRVVRVANSFIFKEPVLNYSGDFPFLWDEIAVPIRLGSDLARAQAILESASHEITESYQEEASRIWKKIQQRFPLEDATTKPLVTIVFDQNWVTFTVRYTVRFDRRRTTKHTLSSRILGEIESTGGAVSIAASAIELFPKAPFKIRTSRSDEKDGERK